MASVAALLGFQFLYGGVRHWRTCDSLTLVVSCVAFHIVIAAIIGPVLHVISYCIAAIVMLKKRFPYHECYSVDIRNRMRQLGELALVYGTVPVLFIAAYAVFCIVGPVSKHACISRLCT